MTEEKNSKVSDVVDEGWAECWIDVRNEPYYDGHQKKTETTRIFKIIASNDRSYLIEFQNGNIASNYQSLYPNWSPDLSKKYWNVSKTLVKTVIKLPPVIDENSIPLQITKSKMFLDVGDWAECWLDTKNSPYHSAYQEKTSLTRSFRIAAVNQSSYLIEYEVGGDARNYHIEFPSFKGDAGKRYWKVSRAVIKDEGKQPEERPVAKADGVVPASSVAPITPYCLPLTAGSRLSFQKNESFEIGDVVFCYTTSKGRPTESQTPTYGVFSIVGKRDNHYILEVSDQVGFPIGAFTSFIDNTDPQRYNKAYYRMEGRHLCTEIDVGKIEKKLVEDKNPHEVKLPEITYKIGSYVRVELQEDDRPVTTKDHLSTGNEGVFQIVAEKDDEYLLGYAKGNYSESVNFYVAERYRGQNYLAIPKSSVVSLSSYGEFMEYHSSSRKPFSKKQTPKEVDLHKKIGGGIAPTTSGAYKVAKTVNSNGDIFYYGSCDDSEVIDAKGYKHTFIPNVISGGGYIHVGTPFLAGEVVESGQTSTSTKVELPSIENKPVEYKYKVGDKIELYHSPVGFLHQGPASNAIKITTTVIAREKGHNTYYVKAVKSIPARADGFNPNDPGLESSSLEEKSCAYFKVNENYIYGKQGMMSDLVETFKADGREAVYRATARKMTKETRAALVTLLKLAGAKNKEIKLVQKLAESEFGLGLIGVGLGLAFKYIPTLKDNQHAQILAKEFRVEGMTTEMVMLADKLQDMVMPMIGGHLEFLKMQIPAPPTRIAVPETASKPVVAAKNSKPVVATSPVTEDDEAEEEQAELEAELCAKGAQVSA